MLKSVLNARQHSIVHPEQIVGNAEVLGNPAALHPHGPNGLLGGWQRLKPKRFKLGAKGRIDFEALRGAESGALPWYYKRPACTFPEVTFVSLPAACESVPGRYVLTGEVPRNNLRRISALPSASWPLPCKCCLCP
jgi:hypothetical protein